MKIKNVAGIVSIVGTVLGVAGTVLSGWSQNKTMNETIKKEVEKALDNAAKGS